MLEILQPEGWAKPKGYSNGIAARGRTIYVGGQIGWNPQCEFETDDFAEQFRQTLANVIAVVEAAGGNASHIATMTWFFTSRDEYLESLKSLGPIWRDLMGRHYPAIAAVQVAGLVEARAKIEIQATAVIPD